MDKLAKVRVQKLVKRREEQAKKVASITIPQPREGQPMTPALAKRQAKASKELEAAQRQLERTETAIAGLETGVTSLIDELVVDTAWFLCTIEQDLRPLWLQVRALAARQRASGAGRGEAETQPLLVPPPDFADPVRPDAPTLPLPHAAALTHDLSLLRKLVVDSICPPEPGPGEATPVAEMSRPAWFAPELGLLNTPLHLACAFCRPEGLGAAEYRETAKFIIDAVPFKALVALNGEGDSALVLACAAGGTATAQAIASRGAPVDAQAAFLAAAGGHADTLRWLMGYLHEREEELFDVVAAVHASVGHIVVQAASREEISADAYTACMDALVECGMDINTRNREGQTMLHIAAKEQCVHPVAIDLLRRGADPGVLDEAGRSARDYVHRLDKDALRDMFDFYASDPATLPAPPLAA